MTASHPENTLAIIGAGSWGTALAIVLAPRFPRIRLWVYEQDLAERMRLARLNDLYLPGFPLPANVTIETDFAAALNGAATVLSVMPSHLVRTVYSGMLRYLDPAMVFVSATKGLENGTLLRASEVIHAFSVRALRTARCGDFRTYLRARGGARRSHRAGGSFHGLGAGSPRASRFFRTDFPALYQSRSGGRRNRRRREKRGGHRRGRLPRARVGQQHTSRPDYARSSRNDQPGRGSRRAARKRWRAWRGWEIWYSPVPASLAGTVPLAWNWPAGVHWKKSLDP